MIFNSFQLTLLILQVATSIPATSTMDDCQKLKTSPQCKCSPSSYGYEIQCPAMVQNPKIKIRVNHRISKVALTCNHFDNEEYQFLPDLNISNVQWMVLEECPLPSKHISQIASYLGLKKLEVLKLENHILTPNIKHEHLRKLSDLKRLSLDVTDLSLIQEDLFMDLPNLDSLIIHSSKISLSRNTFAALVNLIWLKLEVKNLHQLPVGIFRNQSMLQVLEVDKTLLCNITKNFFEDIKSIIELSLRSNGIKSFPSDVFSLLTNLRAIDLSNNNFLELPSGIFAYNKQLRKVVMINSTSLKALPSGLFSNLPNFHSAHITCGDVDSINNADELLLTDENIVQINCDLDEIPHDLFSNSSRITKISLSKNKLETLAETLFENQLSLEYLDLSHNRLESLSKELFRYTNQLTVLKISYNYLTNISSDLFSNLIQLEEIYLNNNRIIDIEYAAFFHNKNLRSIYMENNFINEGHPFKYMRELEILNLRNNNVQNFFRGDEMVKLKELDLSHNFITSLNYGDLLCFLNDRLTINLNSNRISKINMTWNFLRVVSIKKHIILTIYLNNNPLNCDCNLVPFLQFVRGALNNAVHFQLNFEIRKLVCDKPDYMKNLNFLEIGPNDLLCRFNFQKCPLGCECWERAYDSVLLVNCSGIKLTDVPALPPVQPLGFESIELHIENNELMQLPIVSKSGYADVTRIYVSGNKLSRIDVDNLPANLTFLDLSRNKFTKFNMLNIFIQHNSLKEIVLSENPWNCDCEGKLLIELVKRNYKSITDIDKVYCDSPKNSNMIEYFDSNDLCKNGQEGHVGLNTTMISILVVCLLIAVTAVLYYKYQTEVKIWLYKYNFCPCWVNEEELDKDKKYDAFVSYSNKDEEFVLGQLVPQLENGPIRFKLCVHVRDFIVGDIIPDQIIRAIADSRRTIVVLSENFIKSVWARMEFRLAHQAGLDEKRTKVIVIVYGEIGDTKLLDLELQAYLKMTTYLEWGNPWFWERLRYIMPHPIRRNGVNELKMNEL